ncbi:hypothetical protein [Nitrosomonas sp.]|uniref:hypothetical protein n=1 Tax=Nitrosomonas sp. TaxID=42353 RepID=UPI001E0E9C13|nr:hypothetical protein [Nitrosomonas sp.]MBX3616814.1 hypothetical protein [Nitrosomonas sp.]
MTDNKTTETTPVAEPSAAEAKDSDVSTVDACIAHAREVKDTQLELIKSKQYDFAPEFRDLTIQLYLFGVMWKFAENLGNVKDARELAFTALQTMLIQDGLQKHKTLKRIEFLRKMSKLEDDHNALAVAIGYESEPDDNSLAEVFDHYVDDLQVSGAFWRLYDRGKKIMLYGGLGIAFLVIWFITLFMPGNSAIAILAAGLISAAIFVIPVFLIGVFIYHTKLKKAKPTS